MFFRRPYAFGNPAAMGGGTSPPTETWILATSFWADTGVWLDNETWND